MKTQLLEDIGQSAALSLVPSGIVADLRSPQAPAATPVRPHSAFGVWRQRPAGEPEPIAAVEAQDVPPPKVIEVAISPAEPTLAVHALQSVPAPQGPVFDFTLPSPTTPAPDLFNREPRWFERSGQRYLLWGSCVLTGALVIQAGLWLFEERKDARTLALVAEELKAEPQVDKAVKRRAMGAKNGFTLGADGEVLMTPAAPASTPSTLSPTAPAVPPLVLLEPVPAAAAKVEPAAGRADRQAPPKPELIAEQAPAISLPKRVRQIARAPVIHAERKTEQDFAMAEMLKACKEHGYHAAQCVKRGCSVTKYGFVCRGK